MRLQRHTRNIKKVLYSPITILVLAVIAVILVRAAVNSYNNQRENLSKLSEMQKMAQDSQKRRQFLEDEIEKLQTERGIEQELREKFPVAKDGENMVIIVEPETDDTSYVVSKESRGLWQWLKGLFK